MVHNNSVEKKNKQNKSLLSIVVVCRQKCSFISKSFLVVHFELFPHVMNARNRIKCCLHLNIVQNMTLSVVTINIAQAFFFIIFNLPLPQFPLNVHSVLNYVSNIETTEERNIFLTPRNKTGFLWVTEYVKPLPRNTGSGFPKCSVPRWQQFHEVLQ